MRRGGLGGNAVGGSFCKGLPLPREWVVWGSEQHLPGRLAHCPWRHRPASAPPHQALRELDPWSLDVAEQAAALQRVRAADKRKERSVFANMFDRGSVSAPAPAAAKA